MNIYVLTVFVISVSVPASSQHCIPSNPCKDVKYGKKEDLRDCAKYYECEEGQIIDHVECEPAGTSFYQEMHGDDYGGCDLPEPMMRKNCYIGETLPTCKGTLGQWSEWSACSATCGQGKQQRKRNCHGHGDCDGPLEDERDCPDLPNCKGAPGQWSDWSYFSATCGELRRRTWKCIGPGDCEGLVIDEEKETCDK